MTFRARVPCMHSDLVTRVERSANSHPDRPGAFARTLDLLIVDKPPVADESTVEDEVAVAAVRLAQLEKEKAEQQAKNRARRARNKEKAKLQALEDTIIKLSEAMYHICSLLTLFRQPLRTVDALSGQPEQMLPELVLPTAEATLQMTQKLPDIATQWVKPILSARDERQLLEAASEALADNGSGRGKGKGRCGGRGRGQSPPHTPPRG